MLAALLPLFNICFSYFSAKTSGRNWLGFIASAVISLAACIAIFSTFKAWHSQTVWHKQIAWFNVGEILKFSLGIWADTTALLMLSLILFVSALVHWFSIEYMKGQDGLSRYFGSLALFTTAMCGLVLSDNLLSLFMCWELVGFASYLLIGFWYEKDAASKAAQKAFIVNRIGDAGLLTAIFACWAAFGTTSIPAIKEIFLAANHSTPEILLLVAGFGFLLACAGKSAQFPLQIWLPDAMEGPTPVSALIHAATMVAAGIYLLVRMHFMLPELVLHTAVVIGTITMLFAALTAVGQTDIKKVLAFSTISQLGYMTVAIGLGYPQVAFFHLLTHAFFKAALFLCAGSVIHSLHGLEYRLVQWGEEEVHFDTQDMRLMGGLRKAMPFTFIVYTIAAAALSGLPFFSGFLSKEAIVLSAVAWAELHGSIAWLVPAIALLTAAITTFYMMRQWCLVFWGEFRLAQEAKQPQWLSYVHEARPIMLIPMLLLAFLSLFFCFSSNPFDAHTSWFWQNNPPAVSAQAGIVMLASLMAVSLGIGMAYLHYGLHFSVRWSFNVSQVLKNQFYIGKIYKKLLITPLQIISEQLSKPQWQPILFKLLINPVMSLSEKVARFDEQRIDKTVNYSAKFTVVISHFVAFWDRFITDGSLKLGVWLIQRMGNAFRAPQNGNVQNYIWYSFVFILLCIVFWVL